MKDLLLQYEKDFFNAEFCGSRANLETRLSKDFIEYGKSGSIHDRESTIRALMDLSEDKQIEIAQFEITALDDEIVLVHYTSYDKDENSYSLRTSIWKIEGGNWKIYFHQGTPRKL